MQEGRGDVKALGKNTKEEEGQNQLPTKVAAMDAGSIQDEVSVFLFTQSLHSRFAERRRVKGGGSNREQKGTKKRAFRNVGKMHH